MALTLFVDQESNAPTKFLLERIYVGRGDDRTINEGTWQTTTGSPTDAEAVVVQLDTAPLSDMPSTASRCRKHSDLR